MWIFYSALRSAFELRRTCPQCGTIQAVSLRRLSRTVTCPRCGATVPAPRRS